MAKAKKRSMSRAATFTVKAASKPSMSKSETCGCTCGPGGLVWMVLGVIACALGLFALVNGVLLQWNGGNWLNVAIWYAAGLFVVGLGKS